MKKKSIDNILNSSKGIESCLMFYDLTKLQESINKINFLRSKYNIDFLFPVKSFPHKKIIKFFYKNNFGFDIANFNEYMLIKDIINENVIVSYNGPTLEDLNVQKSKGKIIYNISSISDLNNNVIYNGIRVNIYSKKRHNFSRFGIFIQDYYKLNFTKIENLSFHFYEEDKKAKKILLLKKIKEAIKLFPNLKYINFGGDWNIIDVISFEKTINFMRKSIPLNIKFLFEPGEAWFNCFGYLITSVIGINTIANKKIIYINAIKDCVAKWSILTPINLNLGKFDGHSYIISGCSCYEKDIFSVTKESINISIGDKIIFKGLNGYSYAWRKSFNDFSLPKVVFNE